MVVRLDGLAPAGSIMCCITLNSTTYCIFVVMTVTFGSDQYFIGEGAGSVVLQVFDISNYTQVTALHVTVTEGTASGW